MGWQSEGEEPWQAPVELGIGNSKQYRCWCRKGVTKTTHKAAHSCSPTSLMPSNCLQTWCPYCHMLNR